jgi:DNA-binding NarL/FixJ family response regulator
MKKISDETAVGIKVILADDHNLFIEGLKTMLLQMKGIEVVTEAKDGEELIRKLRLYHTDLVICDIQMPKLSGIEAVRIIRKEFPEIKVLMLSMQAEMSYVKTLFELGVHGYLLKNADRQEFESAIRKIVQGSTYFSSDLMSVMMSNPFDPSKQEQEVPLTRREKEILSLIVQEFNNAAIAEKLFISLETVNSHRKNLLRKLNVKNTAGLVKYALSVGLE